MDSQRPRYLLLVRHAIAEDRAAFARGGRPDDLRPLTERGVRRMELAARGIRAQVERIDHLATSPLVRAVQTAEILAEVFGGPEAVRADALAAGSSERFLDWYRGAADAGTVAAVGHEPWLGGWASWLLAGRPGDFVVFKKGAACLLEFPGEVAPGAAVLHWHLAPVQLRALGGRA